MRSTFMGLETAKRGMFTQQSALYTTGHNISNANTPGYTRQRVNFQTTTPYPAVGLNRPNIPGQMGTGVEAGSVQRIRDSFLDTQYRSESTKLGYWSSRSDALSKVEDIINEPTDDGLSAVMGELWQSLQDLAGNPENEGTRGVVLERMQSVTDTFNYMSDSLTSIQKDFGNQVNVTLKATNSAIDKLHDVNQQIKSIEPNGYLPNDLYDERDRLLDELSQYFSIETNSIKSGGNALDIAEGVLEVSIVNADGSKVQLVSASERFHVGFAASDDTVLDGVPDSGAGVVSLQVFKEDTINPGEWTKAAAGDFKYVDKNGNNINSAEIDFATEAGAVTFSQGELRGLIEAYGYQTRAAGSETVKGIYSDMLDQIDQMAFTFATMFNTVQGYGVDLNNPASSTNKNFFNIDAYSSTNYKGIASAIGLNENMLPKDIAAAMSSYTDASGKHANAGDGKNAQNLSNIGAILLNGSSFQLNGSDTPADMPELPIKSGSLNSFYEGVIGGMAVDAQQAARMVTNAGVLKDSVETNRQSVSSVSLDEEMTNLIKFQHAYNGAARMITVVDEMLDKIINGMGVGGR
ncbi:flagellar hook-associated protein FlgK [Domibacillus sp. DTU_2020_1001157_1_SI_ALB_TIR_016]|uniref:flagellar hook-associated protein FlgK n=1 Tax=Domibacillus sp. DTU_2020_1001157_1_SI_ALB_TIR_016 TaxID=3077789 RepID=UPI0028E3A02A|nr:flagellar hook-associated protein FlgK [Domibacillus sp. DTU_2020_1001157_1_SI_ALB_TIR_016]WNS81297.1 flagellar hook-associated protein FlgK [Domibacillus sp. DTU_2020_1001157_1_SI_ALB_TIR_016]